MTVNREQYEQISRELVERNVTLVAVSKTKPVSDIRELYEMGQRDFGENYVQELVEKHRELPEDIRWHFIGHLQSNKVKLLAPFVTLIHGVDSYKLLQEIDRQAARAGRVQDVLLQLHIAKEETKFGLDEAELAQLLEQVDHSNGPRHIRICGLMGMASFTENKDRVREEFSRLRQLYGRYQSRKTPQLDFHILSMGMSGDYQIAVEEGSNLVRLGSLLFGARSKNTG